jgi:GxxExxY protein
MGLDADNRDPRTAAIMTGPIEVRKAFGPGPPEGVRKAVHGVVHEQRLAGELSVRGLRIARPAGVPPNFKGGRSDIGDRAGMVVNNEAVLELKAVEKATPVHETQLLDSPRLSGKAFGPRFNSLPASLRDPLVRLAI